ncbi:NTP transferase domain-containing protein [uncultured Polaribacter sp.]|uniref:NTP transferase domain-containing protein n=1 Tax=uncultured Polaribacter sp. TaxID=174711 RepID=UPI00260C1B27|nr:NTP transferase domain-containing protein [uncultured Polaribacter sp.]
MSKHKKHTNLERRNNATFATNELVFLGTKCGVIADLVHKVSEKIANFKLAYFDASHAKSLDSARDDNYRLSEYVFHHEGNVQISTSGNINKFQQRLDFAQFDCVFINGNHYTGSKQVVFLDIEKEASINKRIDQISEIEFFIKLSKDVAPFQSIKDKFPNWKEIPQYELSEIEKITNHISGLLEKTIPNVKGLVLVGGKSTRMGADKSQLNYFGKPQKEHVKELLENNNLETFYSVRPFDYAQVDKKEIDVISSTAEKSQEIPDVFLNLGPFGGICSAFQKDPNSAWLVMATDVPFVDEDVIQLLLKNRNPSKVATAIKGKGKEFVEPLITIYEPKAYPILLQYLAQGYSCPRKMLINSYVEIIEIEDALIRNINTPLAFKEALNELNKL